MLGEVLGLLLHGSHRSYSDSDSSVSDIRPLCHTLLSLAGRASVRHVDNRHEAAGGYEEATG